MLQNKKYDIGLTFSTHNLSNILSSSTNTGNVMIKLTIILAILFFLFSLLLANLIKDVRNKNNIWQPLKHVKCLKQNVNK
ncbi:MAG: preprotein translocase subunit SecG [Candidatus Lightella neohaematopini]|nr:preprotein translocase subunit SecG [Candidatus Lightella neohaematopini]